MLCHAFVILLVPPTLRLQIGRFPSSSVVEWEEFEKLKCRRHGAGSSSWRESVGTVIDKFRDWKASRSKREGCSLRVAMALMSCIYRRF